MVKTRIESMFLIFLLIFSASLRLPQLGYSSFYGDEVKTLYVDKTQSASQFFLSQRKGPLQFMVVWVVEKFKGYDELWVRVPFAVAGVLSVGALYLLSRKFFGRKAAAISSLFFSVSGFSIAFSRTAQYQSFLILLGLLSVYLFTLACEKRSRWLFLAAGFLLGISLLFHYDAVFYLIPIIIVGLNHIKNEKSLIKPMLLYFIFPAVLVCALFYIPYIYKGFFESQTIGYLSRRVTGKEYLPNNSLYTFFVYNPSLLALIPIFAALIYLVFSKNKYHQVLFTAWFLIPFIVFQAIFKNPGTHILNYLIPAYILSGAGFVLLLRYKGLLVIPALLIIYLGVLSYFVYLPIFNRGYPWTNSKFPLANLRRADKSYNLFLYGFPYNRGWNQIRQYFLSERNDVRISGVYTNDNETIAKYYLKEFNYTRPGSNFIPQYYIQVLDNQETADTPTEIRSALDKEYSRVKDILVEGKIKAIIYKQITI